MTGRTGDMLQEETSSKEFLRHVQREQFVNDESVSQASRWYPGGNEVAREIQICQA